MTSHNSNYLVCPHCGNETRYHAIHFESAPSGISTSAVKSWFLHARHHHVATHVCDYCHNLIKLDQTHWPAIYYVWIILLTALGTSATAITLLYLLGS